VIGQRNARRLLYLLIALVISPICSAPVAADDLYRFSYNVRGDAKPIVLYADEVTTWTESGRRVILLKGKVLVEHGVVQVRAQNAVAWIDQQRQTGILRLDLYAEGDVALENGPESHSSARALADLSTRGELKLRSNNGKVIQASRTDDPLYRRAEAVRSPQANPAPPSGIRPVSYQEAVPPPPVLPSTAPAVAPVQGPPPGAAAGSPGAGQPLPAPSTAPAPPSSGPFGVPVPIPQGPVQSTVPTVPAPTPSVIPPSPTPTVPIPAPPVTPSPAPNASGAGPSTLVVPPAKAPPAGPPAAGNAPTRDWTIRSRNPGGLNFESFAVSKDENVVVLTGGIILIVRTDDLNGLVDIEADRCVFWTHGNTQEVLNNLRSEQSQHSRELEFYLSGNVEIRQQNPKGSHVIRADQVYYDVAHDVAVAMRADLEYKEPRLPDPVHMHAEELLKLSPTQYKGLKAEVFSSRLPSDPGLKVYVSEATLEEKSIERRSIFGIPFLNRTTGEPDIEEQRFFDGRNAILEFEKIPIFYLPFIRGDANDPLGPLESVNLDYNRIYGARIGATFNVYDLLGMDPVPNTRWRFDTDYLSNRGPALGTEYDYSGKSFLTLPATLTGLVKGYGIYDKGVDILGGDRTGEPHTDWRGRLLWRQNVQDLPEDFTLQTQVSWLSDKNFLEQYYKNEFDSDLNQETFSYLKQQRDNWAWTTLIEERDRAWVTETSWLPRADGYLIGQSFFDLLTYNAHASAGYARLRPTSVAPPLIDATDETDNTGRLDLMQEISLPFSLGAFRLVPYALLDLTYYSSDLEGNNVGRVYEGGGLRASIPFSRLFPDVKSDLLNLDGIYHKIVFSANYFIAHSDVPYTRLPQLDRLNDDATDQALRDITPQQPALNPTHGTFLATSPLFDPQIYAIQQLVDNRIDTLDTIEVFQFDMRQRWQTKRGYPGQEHIVDWMTLDLSGSYFPNPERDNFGQDFAFLQYDWIWNIGDRTALVSSGWYDPIQNGPRVFDIGAILNRPDRTSFYLGYREIDPLNSQAVTGAVTYIFSPKYAMTASATYDFGVKTEVTSLILTRMGSDLQVSFGINYNSILNTFGVAFEIVPNIIPTANRAAMGAIGTPLIGR